MKYLRRGIKGELTGLALAGGLVSLILKRRKTALLCVTAAILNNLLSESDSATEGFLGHSVVITGGSRGLGLALAEELLKDGARVCILARDEDELLRAKSILVTKKIHPKAQLLDLPCDVTQADQVEAAFRAVKSEFGGIDMLINNAGAITVGPLSRMCKQDFSAQLDLHFFAVMNTVNTALPYLRQSQGRRIVNICSMGGKVAVPHMLPYDVSKFALSGYSQGLMAELSSEEISVTTVYPALMRTGSPIQAVFKGDFEREFEWFATADVLPGLSSSASDVAQKIIRSARNRDIELVPSLVGKLRGFVAVLLPEMVGSAMKIMASLLPDEQGQRGYQTGADSRKRFAHNPWLQVLRRMSLHLEAKMNQEDKSDARFNMGLAKRV